MVTLVIVKLLSHPFLLKQSLNFKGLLSNTESVMQIILGASADEELMTENEISNWLQGSIIISSEVILRKIMEKTQQPDILLL